MIRFRLLVTVATVVLVAACAAPPSRSAQKQAAPSGPTPITKAKWGKGAAGAVIARFQHYDRADADELLADLGFDPDMSELFVHQRADTSEATFGPIAVVSFESHPAGWAKVQQAQARFGSDVLSQAITRTRVDNAREQLGDDYLGMSEVAVLNELKSLTWNLRYVEDTGTVYQQLYWVTYGESVTAHTVFYVAEDNYPRYRDDFSAFIRTVAAWAEQN